MIKNDDAALGFDFRGRNRRPPKDPVNALLSLAYSLLTDLTIVAQSVEKRPIHGVLPSAQVWPSCLSLDMMEEFRSIIADSVVLVPSTMAFCPKGTLFLGRVQFSWERRGVPDVHVYERRMQTNCDPPCFWIPGQLSAGLGGSDTTGEIPLWKSPEYPGFETR